jgi:hypothetical protein
MATFRFGNGTTMTVNNVCKWLIVYGSYVPGTENHKVFSGLPGEWKKGKILCDLIDPPDGIGPAGRGENDEVEAWTIEFSDCQTELFTPEWEAQKRLLYDRWTALDRAMGQAWVRNQERWWPEDSDPVVGENGMIVVNIYVPLKNFPYLADRDDAPSPDEADDFHGMWSQVKARKKRYDWSEFLALIKDATPGQYAELFGDLPGGKEFIRKLERFYQEHRKGSGNLLSDGKSEFCSLYVCPLERHALAADDLIKLVKADVANRAALLQTAGFDDEARSIEGLTFTFGKPPKPAQSVDQKASAALEHAADFISESKVANDHWIYCVEEACYGIAASYELAHWLMSHWYAVEFDFEPTYGIWKAGGFYEIAGDTCHVYRSALEK